MLAAEAAYAFGNDRFGYFARLGMPVDAYQRQRPAKIPREFLFE